MEENQKKEQQFLISYISELANCSKKTGPVLARFSLESGSPELRFGQSNNLIDDNVFNVKNSQVSFCEFCIYYYHLFIKNQ